MRMFFPSFLALAIVGCGSGREQKSQNELSAGSSGKPRILKSEICDDGEGGLALLAPLCRTTKTISTFLESTSLGFSIGGLTCLALPEPSVTKLAAGIAAVGTTVSSVMKFVVDNLPCEEGVLSPAQERAVRQMICQEAGGTLQPDNVCFKPQR